MQQHRAAVRAAIMSPHRLAGHRQRPHPKDQGPSNSPDIGQHTGRRHLAVATTCRTANSEQSLAAPDGLYRPLYSRGGGIRQIKYAPPRPSGALLLLLLLLQTTDGQRGLPTGATPTYSGRDGPVDIPRTAGDHVLTAENLITGALADDDVMGGCHIGIHRPSGSTGGSGIAAARPHGEGRMAVTTRGFGGRRRDDTDLPPGQYRTDDFPAM